MTSVIVDAAGGQIGGAARYRGELLQYLHRTRREDVRVIGAERRISPAWLLRREAIGPARNRRVAVNNVSFVSPGSERWTLLASPLDFLTDDEWANLHPSLRSETRLRAPIVHMAARRSHVIVAPCTGMAERITRVLPDLRSRVTVRMHPVSVELPGVPRDPVILCPVFFAAYKHMVARIRELLITLDQYDDSSVELAVTAKSTEIPADIAHHPRLRLVGQLDHKDLRQLWARSRAVFFPSTVESFGYPLAEARVNGQPVIAVDTDQNREIAGPALCGFAIGDMDSLGRAVERALTTAVAPDPDPFDPDAYFTWLLGRAS
ncbi:MAG: glycosyltransferase [Streptosporangiaceae bacterium]